MSLLYLLPLLMLIAGFQQMPLLSQQTKSWLTIRNDDIHSFRWANNEFGVNLTSA